MQGKSQAGSKTDKGESVGLKASYVVGDKEIAELSIRLQLLL